MDLGQGLAAARRGGAAVFVILLVFAAAGIYLLASGHFSAGDFFVKAGSVFKKSFSDVFAPQGSNMKLAAEIDLSEKQGGEAAAVTGDNNNKTGGSEYRTSAPQVSASGVSEEGKNINNGIALVGGVTEQENITKESSATSQEVSNESTAKQSVFEACNFSSAGLPTHQIIFSEIAWMGSPPQNGESLSSAGNNEWIEIKNNSGGDFNLTGYQILDESGNFKITLNGGKLSSGALYLLERTDDNSVPGVTADKIYSGTLSNSGMYLKFFGSNCVLLDEVLASEGWPAGDNATKHTMSRNPYNLSWYTSGYIGGTPRAPNADASLSVSAPPQPSAPTSENQTSSPPSSGQSQAPAVSGADHVLVSEVMYELAGCAKCEFIELYNPTSQNIDLKQLIGDDRLRIIASTGSIGNRVITWQRTIIPTKGYFLFVSSDYQELLSLADATYSAYLTNQSGVQLTTNSGNTVIDEVRWSEGQFKSGESWERRSWDSNQFVVQSNPNPRNSGSL